ncbi:MAG: hypothetical protein JKY36_06895 [Erythrobacter sp.]|jgi:hypothetical protein|nr:hypothetical protein [Erythrobacter sp.]
MGKVRFYIALYILILSSAFYSGVSLAEDYYWQIGSDTQTRGETPDSSCSKLASKNGRTYQLQYSGGSTAACYLYMGPVFISQHSVVRQGSGCTLPSIYNPTTGGCEAPQEPGGEKCGDHVIAGVTIPKITTASGECVPFYDADKPSQCEHLSKSTRTTTVYVEYDGEGNPIPPPPVISQGCVATVIDVSHCKAPATPKPGTITLGPPAQRCKVGVSFSGEVADGDAPSFVPSATSPDVCPEGESCDVPDEPVITDRKPCSYYADGEGMVSCQSSDYRGVPGESTNCGSFNNAEWNCNYTKQPSSNGVSIDTKVETKSNPDGGTTTTKTDIRTDVNCTGVNSCQSVTTKTTNVTIKDGNGNTTSSETKCEGAKCGTGIGKGDGTGTGDGDCIVDCGEEEVGGDLPGNDEVAGFGESLTSFYARAGNSPVFAAVQGIAMPSGGSCNFGSATIPVIGSISFNWVCQNADLFDPLYYVMLAIWALAAVRVFLEA